MGDAAAAAAAAEKKLEDSLRGIDNYTSAKSIATASFDLALLGSNLAVLRAVVTGSHDFKALIITLVSISMFINATAAVISGILYAQNPDVDDPVLRRRRYGPVTRFFNYLLIPLALLSLVINAIIATFSPASKTQ